MNSNGNRSTFKAEGAHWEMSLAQIIPDDASRVREARPKAEIRILVRDWGPGGAEISVDRGSENRKLRELLEYAQRELAKAAEISWDE